VIKQTNGLTRVLRLQTNILTIKIFFIILSAASCERGFEICDHKKKIRKREKIANKTVPYRPNIILLAVQGCTVANFSSERRQKLFKSLRY
jgi:hypothetical protein